MKDIDVIVVGELNVDLVLNQMHSFPEIGKEKLAHQMTLTLGSSSAIFASNLSSLGAKVSFIGKIGQDQFGKVVLQSLQNKGVDTSLILQSPALNTGLTVVLNFDEDRAMVTHPGAMDELRLTDISPEHLARARHLHFSSYFLQPGLKNGLPTLFQLAKSLGLTTSFDTQWDPQEKWDLNLTELLPLVDVFLPNEKELLRLTQTNTLSEALATLPKNAHLVLVKMGNKGSVSWCQGKVLPMESFLNKEVVDAIGAGDSFNAGFIYKYIQGSSLEECQRFGNLTGAISTTESGGTTAFTDYNKIKRIAQEKFGYAL
ncbi:carbohydrate kinase family protein [Adhaeribacter arboris]|uniref:Carbohydrate kinase family protein n=1 Tax=Adhaeribacter arboris TaxID=2072846 RepID=A0A2T2YL54_9BACT|nr:carbohydrate kinase family protein [Adhaeribacter arboris]PSR56244.1 carbohydrate kinase family protein [Adhaeribacter arboris]